MVKKEMCQGLPNPRSSSGEHDAILMVSNVDAVPLRIILIETNSQDLLAIATITGITLPHSPPAIFGVFGSGKLINTNNLIILEMRRGNIPLIRFSPFQFCE
jgi:hypothetical protein